jgi:hypothetical protein
VADHVAEAAAQKTRENNGRWVFAGLGAAQHARTRADREPIEARFFGRPPVARSMISAPRILRLAAGVRRGINQYLRSARAHGDAASAHLPLINPRPEDVQTVEEEACALQSGSVSRGSCISRDNFGTFSASLPVNGLPARWAR